jgi:NAD(P)-dependent dehydrogenase (short-subunit alcohol dehydrogenase family)
MPTVLVTGAGRGIGLEFVRQYCADGWRVIALEPMKMAEAFVKQVAASAQKKMVTLTSIMGSIAQNNLGGMYAYRSTKAAANAIVKTLALDLNRHGIVVVAMHPGWVRTDMGGPSAQLDVETSVAGMRRAIADLSRAQSGCFLSYEGKELPW